MKTLFGILSAALLSLSSFAHAETCPSSYREDGKVADLLVKCAAARHPQYLTYQGPVAIIAGTVSRASHNDEDFFSVLAIDEAHNHQIVSGLVRCDAEKNQLVVMSMSFKTDIQNGSSAGDGLCLQ